MMKKDIATRAFGIVLATPLAIGSAVVVYRLWHGEHIALIFLIFIGSWIAFFLAVTWIIQRPDELKRKLPISGTEHRRKNKQFYDWLRSQGRH
jgi:hypothetical protein